MEEREKVTGEEERDRGREAGGENGGGCSDRKGASGGGGERERERERERDQDRERERERDRDRDRELRGGRAHRYVSGVQDGVSGRRYPVEQPWR